MLVRNLMSQPVTTVSENTTVGEALEILRQKNIRRLPVVNKDGQLVGLATEWDLIKIFPVKKTSPFETNLISRTPIKNVMTPNPITISPDETIENAAVVMQYNKVGCLPVVENDRVIGMITLTDILTAFIDALGLEQASVRITIRYAKRMGFLAELIQLIDKVGVIVDNMVTFHSEIVLKIKNVKTEELLKALKENGYQVTHVAYIGSTGECPLEEGKGKAGQGGSF
ncbi:MAG: acetoin utilization protein AcuB [Eubacteriales bacterium]|nr:acetoin utilization protein AcuB [Eubacteriales bacterium]MDN5364460.1 acetoin utilization protein AcuB [Eubacteriales bacterium]